MQVVIIRCNGCGAGLPPETTLCGYCGSAHVRVSSESPFSLKEPEAKACAAFYRTALRSDPDDVTGAISLGLFYLRLRLYDLAVTAFHKCLDLAPDESDVHYYVALALARGRRLKTLQHQEATKIASHLAAATALEDKAHYYAYHAALACDYFEGNGLFNPGPSSAELAMQARSTPRDADELMALGRSIQIPDSCSRCIP